MAKKKQTKQKKKGMPYRVILKDRKVVARGYECPDCKKICRRKECECGAPKTKCEGESNGTN